MNSSRLANGLSTDRCQFHWGYSNTVEDHTVCERHFELSHKTAWAVRAVVSSGRFLKFLMQVGYGVSTVEAQVQVKSKAENRSARNATSAGLFHANVLVMRSKLTVKVCLMVRRIGA